MDEKSDARVLVEESTSRAEELQEESEKLQAEFFKTFSETAILLSAIANRR